MASLADELPLAIVAAADQAGIGVTVSVLTDGDTRRTYVSPAAAQILGHPVEELIGQSTFRPFPPEERTRLLEIQRRWQGGEAVPQTFETVVVRSDGSRAPLEISFSIAEVDGQPAILSLIRDITQRRVAEETLKRSESLFRKLIEAAPEAVSVVRGNRLIYANPRYLQLLGYQSVDELANLNVVDVVHPEQRPGLEERLAYILDPAFSGPRAPREFRLIRKDGRVISTECSSLAIDFEGATAVLTFIRDVTKRKEEQAQLIQTDRMATIGTLAAGVAHEINNPLGYVMLNLEVIARDLDTLPGDPTSRSRVRERMQMVQEGVRHIAAIVRDLRDFCRPDAPARPVEVRDILESAINMAMTEVATGACVVRDYRTVRPVLADSARLGQVFLNLLLNAVQAQATEIRIALRAEGPAHARIEIADNGHGIIADNLDRIFEPFFTTKPLGIGTGLGLSISQSIVHGMQGQLTVASEVGKGSTFSVTLPATAP